MSNKYSNLVEEINKKEEIAEQKDNLAEQLGQVTKNVSDVKETVGKLETAIDDLKKDSGSRYCCKQKHRQCRGCHHSGYY